MATLLHTTAPLSERDVVDNSSAAEQPTKCKRKRPGISLSNAPYPR